MQSRKKLWVDCLTQKAVLSLVLLLRLVEIARAEQRLICRELMHTPQSERVFTRRYKNLTQRRGTQVLTVVLLKRPNVPLRCGRLEVKGMFNV